MTHFGVWFVSILLPLTRRIMKFFTSLSWNTLSFVLNKCKACIQEVEVNLNAFCALGFLRIHLKVFSCIFCSQYVVMKLLFLYPTSSICSEESDPGSILAPTNFLLLYSKRILNFWKIIQKCSNSAWKCKNIQLLLEELLVWDVENSFWNAKKVLFFFSLSQSETLLK